MPRLAPKLPQPARQHKWWVFWEWLVVKTNPPKTGWLSWFATQPFSKQKRCEALQQNVASRLVLLPLSLKRPLGPATHTSQQGKHCCLRFWGRLVVDVYVVLSYDCYASKVLFFQYAFQFLQSFFSYIIGGLCSEWTASNSTTYPFLRIPVINFKDEGKQPAKRLHSLLGKAETWAACSAAKPHMERVDKWMQLVECICWKSISETNSHFGRIPLLTYDLEWCHATSSWHQ